MSLSEISARLRAAAGSNGATTLIAVSKMQPNDRVEAVLQAGHLVFGENRVQEAAGKWPKFKETYKDVELHLLGPLQTNKARQALDLFDVIHTLDRPKLANRLAALRDELGHCPKLFIQVNTGNEPQKAGVSPADVGAFITQCRDLKLPIIGLMCIPPAGDDPQPHFAMLREMAEKHDLPELSMGMSGDFETAIAEGATYVRVGSAIFGVRP